VFRPDLISAILSKAAATTIAVRANPDRDWSDLAFLLSLVPDPIEAADALTKGQRRTLRKIATLLDDRHPNAEGFSRKPALSCAFASPSETAAVSGEASWYEIEVFHATNS
jgi:hypothetical protein